MRLFGVTAYYSFRALFHWLSPMTYLVYRALFPLSQLAFFALIGTYGGSQPLAFYLVGNTIGTATLTAFGVSQAVGDERQQGTLSYLLAAPAQVIPLPRSVAAGRLYAAGASFDAGLGLLLGDLALGAVYGVAGFLVFNWLETRARREGRLEGV